MDSTNITSTIISCINTIFSKLFSSLDNNLYSILDDLTFVDIDILNDDYFINIFGLASENGLLLIANSLVFGFLLYFAFKYLFSHLGITESERPSKFIFRLIFFGICMNFSLFICEQIIFINSSISSAIRQIGDNLFHCPISFSTLIQKLNSVISIDSDSLDIFSLDGIIKSIISFGMLNLVISYGIRYILLKIFVLIAPFAFLSLSAKSTSILFKSWMKSFISLLLIQVFVSLVLLLIFSLNINSSNTFNKIILTASILILLKANSYVKEMLGGISTDFSIGFNNIKSLIKK